MNYIKEQMYYYYYTRSDIDDYHIYLKNQELSIGRGPAQQRITTSSCDLSEMEDIFEACTASRNNHALYPADSTSSFFTYYHTLIRIRNQEPLALVRLQVDRSFLTQLLDNHSDHGELFLLTDPNGRILYSNTELLPAYGSDVKSLLTPQKNERHKYTTVSLGGEDYLFITSGNASDTIQLISLTPLSYIDSQIGQLRGSLIFSGILIWVCAIFLINMFLRFLTKPLKMLSKQMEQTGNGDFHTRIHTDGSREVIELSNSFNSMVKHIDELIRRTYLAELSEKNARLTALEAQLNPHFLYNTLQAIATEALLNDQPQINTMITSLASNLRYTIKGGDLVPLRQEMEYVKNYIYLQKIRMDDKLSVELNIDPDTEKYLIPKVSIQTLVENSIIHGLRPQTGSIHIKVSSQLNGRQLVICVQDDGIGISDDQLSLLYENFKKQEKSGANGGIGLVNLHTRLTLLYESPADLTIDTQEDKYTRIVLTLPAMQKGTMTCIKR
ncbi:MAG: sensor histidine kinase [Clostridiales bacterium]|nr:sensor histidine kinase [Clostridiales bacterium]